MSMAARQLDPWLPQAAIASKAFSEYLASQGVTLSTWCRQRDLAVYTETLRNALALRQRGHYGNARIVCNMLGYPEPAPVRNAPQQLRRLATKPRFKLRLDGSVQLLEPGKPLQQSASTLRRLGRA